MGLQKFQKNILKATHNLEFSAVSVFPDSGITLDTRMSNLDIRMSKLDIRVSRLDIRVSVPTILVLILGICNLAFDKEDHLRKYSSYVLNYCDFLTNINSSQYLLEPEIKLSSKCN